MIKELIEKFVEDNWEDNRFVKEILLKNPRYWTHSSSDVEIVKNIYDALEYGAGLNKEEMKELSEKYRSDIIIYFEDFLDRTGYGDFFVADSEVPLYKFIMTTVLDDLVYCLGWYIVERLEQEVFPELQDADCLECALSMLIRILQEQEKVELN
uniref:Uncharacterized protein n=1 Tax=Caldicellulosiruptor owensensis TaxID=55205 RepID=A0A7C5V4L1_9FIRM